jgi:hypothetical protein
MSNIAFPNSSASTALRLLVMTGLAVAAAVIIASAVPTVTDLGTATASADPGAGNQHGGPDYPSITGTRVGAPTEQEVSFYGGSHKHDLVEQQLYGPGVVIVPHVDTTVHQSR